MAFHTPTAVIDIYEGSVFTRTRTSWNVLPESVKFSGATAHNIAAKFLFVWFENLRLSQQQRSCLDGRLTQPHLFSGQA